MMVGGAFILLKAGPEGAESAKQAEIRLANLLKILEISPKTQQKPVSVVPNAIFPGYG